MMTDTAKEITTDTPPETTTDTPEDHSRDNRRDSYEDIHDSNHRANFLGAEGGLSHHDGRLGKRPPEGPLGNARHTPSVISPVSPITHSERIRI